MGYNYIIASLYYIIANFLGQGIVLFSNYFFTRIMPQNEYGLYSTYYSIVSIVATFIGANLYVGLARGLFDFKKDKKHFSASIFMLSIIVFLCCSILSLFIIYCLFNNYFPLFINILLLIHAFSFFVVNYYATYQRMDNKYTSAAFISFLQSFIQVFLAIIIIINIPYNSFYERVIGSSLGLFSCALIYAINILKKQHNLFNKKYYIYALKISVPSILSTISYMLIQQSDHVMVTYFVGAEYTAIYSFVFIVGNIIYAFLQATSAAFQPWIYHALDEKKTGNIHIIQKWYMIFYLFIAYGLLMISPELIKFLAPKSYWDFRYIPPFVAGSCLLVINRVYSYVGEFYKKTGDISICVLIAAIFNIILNLFFIKKYGAIAAAYTSFAAYVVLVLLNRCVIQKIHRDIFSDITFIGFSFCVIFGCIVFLIINNNILLRYISFVFLLLGLLIYCYFNRKEIQAFLSTR